MFNVALLSKWHMHFDRYAPVFQRMNDVKISCVWDDDPVRGAQGAKDYGVPFEPDLDKILADREIHGVCITSATSDHKKLIIAAARAGKHVFCEKCLTTHLLDAYEVRREVKRSGIKFSIAYIHRTEGPYLLAKKLVDSGILGRIAIAHVHNGLDALIKNWLPEHCIELDTAGGGVMFDVGCHNFYLLDWLLGEPVSISSTFAYATGREVEDSAVTSVRFRNDAIGVADTTYVSYFSPYVFDIYGDKGSFFFRSNGSTIEVHVAADCKALEELAWLPPEAIKKRTVAGARAIYTIDVAALPSDPDQLRQWVDSCVKGTPAPFDIDEAVTLTKIMTGAGTAAREGRTVRFD